MNNFEELIKRDNTKNTDIERLALFYILANNEDLFQKVNYIYDFDDHSIKIDCFNRVDLSSSSEALVKLAFNLYNGFKAEYSDILSIFSTLDEKNYDIAMKAINIRFRRL